MAFERAFRDRSQAGEALGRRLAALDLENPVIYALPRGGVPVGLEVARALKAPLDLVLVRKLGHPQQPELAIGAIVDGDEPVIVRNEEILASTWDGEAHIKAASEAALKEIDRRRELYLKGRTRPDVRGKTAIVVDDGIATGATVRAALKALKQGGAIRTVLAVPVAAAETLQSLRPEVDDIICLETPEPFYAIGLHYQDFRQVSDEEVVELLNEAAGA